MLLPGKGIAEPALAWAELAASTDAANQPVTTARSTTAEPFHTAPAPTIGRASCRVMKRRYEFSLSMRIVPKSDLDVRLQ
jgi:hypothetical protein